MCYFEVSHLSEKETIFPCGISAVCVFQVQEKTYDEKRYVEEIMHSSDYTTKSNNMKTWITGFMIKTALTKWRCQIHLSPQQPVHYAPQKTSYRG